MLLSLAMKIPLQVQSVPLVMMLFSLLAGSLARAETYAFAPLPMEEPETVFRQYKPLLAHLERESGHRFHIVYSRDYAELLRKFRAGEVDIAYLGPLPYVELKAAYMAAEPIVNFREKSGKAKYTCALFTAGEGNPKPKSGKARVALTQALSTCGYLAADALLAQQRIDIEQLRYRYLGKHDEAVLSVVRGDFEWGTAKTSIVSRYQNLGIRIIQETPELPAFSLVANSARMPQADVDAIRKSLLKLRPLTSQVDANYTATWGENVRYGVSSATDADFDPVRKMRKNKQIPEQGNF
jgi:phosphonate transport system substrate-binding protein